MRMADWAEKGPDEVDFSRQPVVATCSGNQPTNHQLLVATVKEQRRGWSMHYVLRMALVERGCDRDSRASYEPF